MKSEFENFVDAIRKLVDAGLYLDIKVNEIWLDVNDGYKLMSLPEIKPYIVYDAIKDFEAYEIKINGVAIRWPLRVSPYRGSA